MSRDRRSQTLLRKRRVERNEVLFTETTQAFADVRREFADSLFRAKFACECCADDCDSLVEVSLDDYRRVRACHAWFIVTPGHAPGETVVEASDRFEIIEAGDNGWR